MTPSEFKAWFEGFTEAFDKQIPTKVQWARIKERVGEIDGKPITERVFIDRWYPYYHQWMVYSPPTVVGIPYGGNVNTLHDGHSVMCNNTTSFDSCVAMNAIGRAEAVALNG